MDEFAHQYVADRPKSSTFHNSTIHPEFDLTTSTALTIDHVVEDEAGVIAVLEDGTLVRLDGYIGTITLRIRYLLELIASTPEITEEMVLKLREYKQLLVYERQDIAIAQDRIDWAERAIVGKL